MPLRDSAAAAIGLFGQPGALGDGPFNRGQLRPVGRDKAAMSAGESYQCPLLGCSDDQDVDRYRRSARVVDVEQVARAWRHGPARNGLQE